MALTFLGGEGGLLLLLENLFLVPIIEMNARGGGVPFGVQMVPFFKYIKKIKMF